MRDIEIHYNPYKMKTTMRIEGIDVCQSSDYSSIKEFIEHNIPLQTWIEPIPYLNWNGFVDEILILRIMMKSILFFLVVRLIFKTCNTL